jgi:hypothetical protein
MPFTEVIPHKVVQEMTKARAGTSYAFGSAFT